MLGWAAVVGSTLCIVSHRCATRCHVPEDDGGFSQTSPYASLLWLLSDLHSNHKCRAFLSSVRSSSELSSLRESTRTLEFVASYSEVKVAQRTLNLWLVSEVTAVL